MNDRQQVSTLVLLVALIVAATVTRVQAQPTCPYADIRLDTGQAVDVEAICETARPWADDGFQVVVLLTDYRATSEDDWFAFLDQAEAEAGIRDLSQPDAFDKNGIAFEASTATDLAWGYNVTIGEWLYGTALDTDEAVSRIESLMRNGITAGDPTTAFVQALTLSYEIYHPFPTPQATRSEPSPQVEQPQPPQAKQPSSSFPWGWVLIGLLAVGALGAGSCVLAILVIQRTRSKRHLGVLRARTSNLLNACEPLLRGDTPEETVLYQLFSGYGGERSTRARGDVREWLRRSQAALDDAFDLRRKLIDPDVQKKRTPEQLVQDWEMLYVTFVGNSERILALTDDELRTLLDPMLVLDREKADVQLTRQLDDIRRELAGDMPLKVELTMVDPAKTDAEGILGYIDRVKAKIAYVRDASSEAPRRLAEAQKKRRAAEEDLPSPFVMTRERFFADIDERLAQASLALEQEQFLHALEHATDVIQGLETISKFVAAVSEHDRRQAEIEAITGQGYRPGHLEDDLKKIEKDIETITKKITAGDYVKAETRIEKLDTDSQRALAGAQEWRTLHEQNAAELARLRDKVAQVEKYLKNKAEPAWETLRTYSRENWEDADDEMKEARKTLRRMHDRVDRIEQLNSLEEQRLDEAKRLLAQTSADLTPTKRKLQSVVNRLKEVRATETRAQKALRQTEAEIAKLEAIRNRERARIGSQIDRQIEQARRQLEKGQRLVQEHKFAAAIAAQIAAQQLVTTILNHIRRQREEARRRAQQTHRQASRKAQPGRRDSQQRKSAGLGSSSQQSAGSGSSRRRSSGSGSSKRRRSKGSSSQENSTGSSRRR